jgi:transcription elongation factor GreA
MQMAEELYLTSEGAERLRAELEHLKGPERERIQELKYILDNSSIIDNNGKHETVEMGARVTIQEADYPPDTYMVVGAKEANPQNGYISNESPIGTVLMGKKEGDEVVAQTPSGEVRYKIMKIE